MRKEDKSIIKLNQIDSTNNYANRLISSGMAVGGTIVLSEFQEAGRGQRGTHWESAPGMNLLASLILFPVFLPVGMQFYLSKIASLALLELLQKETAPVSIKWPNDIYVGSSKIAGILIETSVQGNQFHSAVVGVGLNLNQEAFSNDLPNPVSLKQLTDRKFDVEEVARTLRKIFLSWYQKLEEGRIPEIDKAYQNNLYRLNEWAQFIKHGRKMEARIVGTGEFGQLLLEDRSGNLSEYMFKEIEFVI